MEYDLSVLKNTTLFAGIPEENYWHVLQCLNAQIRIFPSGQTITAIGDTVEQAGIILQGRAEIVSFDELGNQINMNHCEPGDCFGESLACIQYGKSPLQINTLTKCTILFLGLAKLTETSCPSTCPHRTQMSANLTRKLVQENMFLNQKVQILAQKKLRDRIKLHLQMLTPQNGNRYHIPVSRTAWADFLCVDRSALSRELGRLKTEGIISSEGAEIILLQPDFLE